ncbi:MAG: hypothetical protein COT85_07940 [Chlamydiae bacterium CG10_big_fil_rev_8_21_14_0_10_42_34]|nr:MAG: hypothetical protein COT85_07940 [Chlamydiae bacterium CG10_big_fil_rev_8_21_14_0_10_42_34]
MSFPFDYTHPDIANRFLPLATEENESSETSDNSAEELTVECKVHTEHEIINAIQSVIRFVRPPVEGEYFDEETGKTYQVPNHSLLVPKAMQIFTQGEYKGYGLTLKKHITLPGENKPRCCDLLYFTKQETQIKYENRKPISYASFSSYFSGIEKRIEEQQMVLKNFFLTLKNEASKWKYDWLECLSSEETLEKYGFSEKDAVGLHAIVLFYKEMEA